MAKERRDNKNRILSKGEYQKEDGRYMYKYTDINGRSKYIYSWTLTKSDRTPKGKAPGKCLRDLEKEIAKDVFDGIDTHKAKNTTLNDFFDEYMLQKKRLKPTTRRTYFHYYNNHVRDTVGNKKISDFNHSDIKRLYLGIVKDDGAGISTVMGLNMILNPIFKIAVKDNYIRKNPTEGVVSEVKKDFGYKYEHKKALTEQEQSVLMAYVKNKKTYSKWEPLFTFLLGTGCRIGEACALTWDDCDFDNGIIQINKTLSYLPDEETRKCRPIITKPKSKTSIREIPMLSEVRRVLLFEKEKVKTNGPNLSVVDGVSNFVFSNRCNQVIIPGTIADCLLNVVNSYNREEEVLAKKENRKPVLLPRITPHILRHTFCTRLCEIGTNVKVVQEVMGHSTVSITMNIYTDATIDFKKKTFNDLDGKILIG